jgi:hypothetical protein
MFNWLNKLHDNLPLVRELCDLRKTWWKLDSTQQRALGMLREEFLDRLRSRPRYADPRRLAWADQQVFSQHGEDGITAEIFRRIGTTDRFFAEVGTGDGLENNTAYLFSQGWQGVWVDGDAAGIRRVREQLAPFVRDGKLKPVAAWITRENIGGILRDAGVPDEFDSSLTP